MRETGFHDRRRIPICVGDLIRVMHYRHRVRRQQMWMYFRVGTINCQFVLHAWDSDAGPHQALLKNCVGQNGQGVEILDGPSWTNERGELRTWNERKRKKRGE